MVCEINLLPILVQHSKKKNAKIAQIHIFTSTCDWYRVKTQFIETFVDKNNFYAPNLFLANCFN